MATNPPRLTWNEVITRLVSEVSESPGAVVHVAIADIEHPIHGDMEPIVIEDIGQRMDYQKALGRRVGCHVREFGDRYEAWLYLLPQVSLPVLVDSPQLPVRARQSAGLSLANLPREAPGATVLATTLLGTLFGALVGGAKGAAAGALVGGGAGLAAVGVSNATYSPETALAAHGMFQGLAATALARQSAVRIALPSAPARLVLPSASESSETSKPKATRRSTSKK